jgi:hypothetical protein
MCTNSEELKQELDAVKAELAHVRELMNAHFAGHIGLPNYLQLYSPYPPAYPNTPQIDWIVTS